MPENPKLTFCSGVGTVTGSNFLLEFPAGPNSPVSPNAAGLKILVDCGLVQGEHFAEEANRASFVYDPTGIDVLLITHAHLDHVGRIPKLVKEGFKGIIYSTPQTRELAELVLNDAVGILDMEARRDKLEPLYSPIDVQNSFAMWRTVEYHVRTEIKINSDKADDGFKNIHEGVVNQPTFLFKDAGHILGSAMIEISGGSRGVPGKAVDLPFKILFSGDLGNSPAPLLRDTEMAGDIDYLVIESTYGDRNHESREERTAEFERIIKETISRGGTLVIPAFSVDRTQVLLYELNNMVEQKRIPSVPVFVDSPLAIKATAVYKSSTALFNDTVQKQIQAGDDVFAFPHLQFTVSNNQSHVIDRTKGSKIILAGSGMSVGGRVVGHEEYFLPEEKNTILLVGYQTAGSLGRRLADGAKKVNIHGQTISVKAHIETLYGYSAHKDGDHLLEFVTTASHRLKKVFVVMGEPGASMHLSQRINGELELQALVPEIGKVYDLK